MGLGRTRNEKLSVSVWFASIWLVVRLINDNTQVSAIRTRNSLLGLSSIIFSTAVGVATSMCPTCVNLFTQPSTSVRLAGIGCRGMPVIPEDVRRPRGAQGHHCSGERPTPAAATAHGRQNSGGGRSVEKIHGWSEDNQVRSTTRCWGNTVAFRGGVMVQPCFETRPSRTIAA